MSSFECLDCNKGMRRIDDESIDLIFTDPPYVKAQYRKAYLTLARHAKRILVPSGFLITYAPHYYLDEIMAILGRKLSWYWLVAQINQNEGILMVHQRRVLCGFKPILIYQKPPQEPPPLLFLDRITGRKAKAHHAWEQSIHEALHLLSRFTVPGNVVLDPFAGSGTTLLAAKLLGLEYIGFEIDLGTFQDAQSRLHQEPLDLRKFCEVEA
jgi:DNA modification methylase